MADPKLTLEQRTPLRETDCLMAFAAVHVATISLADVVRLSDQPAIRTLPPTIRRVLAAQIRDLEVGARNLAAHLEE